MPKDEAEVLSRIDEWFDANYERIKSETGHALSPDIRRTARLQVRAYWKRLSEIAKAVTETEVRLNLPHQKTPGKQRVFCIEGVVDIVRDGGKTAMYDVKTHGEQEVRDNIDSYREQLNVYAHIWRNLHGKHLDQAAIIATQLPDEVRFAMESGDEQATAKALAAWSPLVDIPLDDKGVKETVRKFGEVVDNIADCCFAPPPVSRLREKEGKMVFATRVCRNCDARHSCSSYREYAQAPVRRDSIRMREFYDDGAGSEQDERRDLLLDTGAI
jgi:hypothetical protein